jgi:DNA-binding response OmpR family regulator
MLTGRGEVVDRIIGLEMGANYYLPKPFHLRELLATVKAVLRRTSIQTTEKQTRRDRRHGTPARRSSTSRDGSGAAGAGRKGRAVVSIKWRVPGG